MQQQPSRVLIEVAPGELIDKITILEIKAARLEDPAKKQNVLYELRMLETTRASLSTGSPELAVLSAELSQINQVLWDIEDEIRRCEADQDFGARFIELARSVYRTNDQRSRVKRQINQLLGSTLVEEKQYVDYGSPARKAEKEEE